MKNKIVKFKDPQSKEESESSYIIKNYNEITNKCYIMRINSNLSIRPLELVSLNDLIIIGG